MSNASDRSGFVKVVTSKLGWGVSAGSIIFFILLVALNSRGIVPAIIVYIWPVIGAGLNLWILFYLLNRQD